MTDTSPVRRAFGAIAHLDRLAALPLVPYLARVSFAAVPNLTARKGIELDA